jgi:nitrogen fixation/metabolism regulation signal transduction histidine kinase
MYITGAIFFIFAIISCAGLIRYMNKINRWIAFFLTGIENEDTTIKIPEKTGNKAIDDILKGMQKLNTIFKQVKIDIINREQYFKSIINQSATGLFSINGNGRIININPAAVNLTGLQEYYHINYLKKVDAALPDFINKSMKTLQEQSGVFENRHGQKLLFKITYLNNTALVAVSDITKELDTREVDAWIKLSRTLSHEIMNNITPITTLSQVILGYFTKNNRTINQNEIDDKTIKNAIKGLNVIEERSIALMNFVNNYRKFTKLPEPHFADNNISDIIENSLIAANAFNNFNKITIKKNIPGNVMFVTDGNLLSQVIINILKNAYEAVSKKITGESFIQIELFANANTLQIDISNNGEKIPANMTEQIFIPFFTTKNTGSGIGLSLSKQILLQMKGDITLRKSTDKITTFSVAITR